MSDIIIVEKESYIEWQSLIKTGSRRSQVKLSENIESYLIFMLIRYLKKPLSFSGSLTLRFLESRQKSKNERREEMQDVADRCIILAGLFPGFTDRRLVKINYFVDMARSAYSTISRLLPCGSNQSLYIEVKNHVDDMIKVLRCTTATDRRQLEINQVYTEFQLQQPSVH